MKAERANSECTVFIVNVDEDRNASDVQDKLYRINYLYEVNDYVDDDLFPTDDKEIL